jgi:hypothetical protein
MQVTKDGSPLRDVYPLVSTGIDMDKVYPIAEEIVSLLVSKKISYAEACEALCIADNGIKTLKIG